MGIDPEDFCIRDERGPLLPGLSRKESQQLESVFEQLDWIPAQRVHLRPGITVRVAANTYEGELGELHNGRIGVISEIRGGDVIVNTTDHGRQPLIGTHYSPWVLEMKLDDCVRVAADSKNS